MHVVSSLVAPACEHRADSAAPLPLSVSRITDLAGLHALRPEWERLQAVARRTTVFQTWEWVTTWYECFGSRGTLRLLAVRDAAGRLVGVAPGSLSGAVGLRLLHLLGRGNDVTEYVDAILHPDCEQEAGAAMFDAWHAGRGGWDVLIMPSVPADGPFAAAVLGQARARGYLVAAREAVRVTRPLPASWEAFYGSLNRNTKKYIKKFANRLHREGHEERLVVIDDPDRLDAALDLFLELHERRAASGLRRAHRNKFAEPERQVFLRTVTRRFMEHGRAWPCVLEVDGAPVAAQLCFVHNDTLYPYYSGYDPAWAWYGVMSNLFRRCIERAIVHGCTSLDLGLGLDQEKLRWGGEPRPVITLTLAGPGLRSRTGFRLYQAGHAAAFWLRRRRRAAAARGADAAAGEDERDDRE